MKFLIAASHNIAFRQAVMDWGWVCTSKHNGIFKNSTGDEIQLLLPAVAETVLRHAPQSDIYFSFDNLHSDDLTRIAKVIRECGHSIVKEFVDESKLDDQL